MFGDIREFIDSLEKTYGNRAAFWYRDEEGQEVWISCQRFREDIEKAADCLRFSGIEGKTICMSERNSYGWIVFLFSIILTGNTAVLTSDGLDERELEERLISVDCHYKLKIGGTRREPKMILIPFASHQEECDRERRGAVILFTSGTLGRFKAVALSQKNLANAIINGMTDCGYKKMLLLLPLHHSLALNALISALTVGGTLGINQDLKYMYEDMRAFHPEMLFIVPSFLKSFIRRMDKSGDIMMKDCLGDGLRAILSGGGMLQEADVKRVRSLGIEMYSSYGSTETFCIAGGPVSGEEGDVGKVCKHMEIRFMEGEIQVRGCTVADGYYGTESGAFEDGWYATGDLGYMDDQMRLHLTGRKNNLIILSNGENVSPEILEKQLYLIPEIKEALVYGADDRICAEIYTGLTEPENDFVRKQIKEMNRSLQTFFQIQRVIFRGTEFEKTTLGKIRRERN